MNLTNAAKFSFSLIQLTLLYIYVRGCFVIKDIVPVHYITLALLLRIMKNLCVIPHLCVN